MGFKLGDFAVIALILALAAAVAYLSAPGGTGQQAILMLDGRVLERVDLSAEERVFTVSGMRVCIGGGSARVAESDCYDQICVRAGAISRTGQSAVCVPNRVVLLISGGRSGGLDAVIG